jgi:uncharacterized membrane protein (UPF0127 family)
VAFAHVALAILLAVPACKKTEPPPVVNSPDAPAEKAAMNGPAVLLNPNGRPPVRVRVKLARTGEQRRRGLMYVQNLPLEDGMLFLFEEEALQSFWMRNTMIPLDMIFIRSDLTVAGVVENAAPLTEETRDVGKPSRYVLEVNGGMARKWGVKEGTPVTFEGVSGYTGRP